MSKIYLVQGTSGEYSDKSEWIVCAYNDEKQAIEFATELNRLAKIVEADAAEFERVNRPLGKAYAWSMESFESCKELKKRDPNAEMDHTGIDYTVIETELHPPLPQDEFSRVS